MLLLSPAAELYNSSVPEKYCYCCFEKIAKEDDRGKKVAVFSVDEETGESRLAKSPGSAGEKPLISGYRRIGR